MNMENNEEKKDTGGHWILRNILGAIAFFLLLWLACTLVLNALTHHGKSIEVPDFTNMTLPEARRAAHNSGLKIEVVDSIFIRRMERGAVYSQNPKVGSEVKKGRIINLTINAMNPKLVSMPNLVGYSMRQAKAELNARGLALGKLFYVDDIATNNVIRQLYKNRQIKPGKKIESGSEIDLEVGLNPENNLTTIPDLMNKKYLRAVDDVHENSLNIGRLVFDSSVKDYADTLNAQVYKQVPGKSNEPVLMGSDVTLYLSIDPNKITLKENKAE
jgi:beta-lactam-binding protein with PASTA domain